jgi:hypothetical protein
MINGILVAGPPRTDRLRQRYLSSCGAPSVCYTITPMLRHLSHVARAFASALDVAQVFEVLDEVVAPTGLQTIGSWPRRLGGPEVSLFAPALPDKLKADIVSANARRGPSLLARHAETAVVAFTVIASMRNDRPGSLGF